VLWPCGLFEASPLPLRSWRRYLPLMALLNRVFREHRKSVVCFWNILHVTEMGTNPERSYTCQRRRFPQLDTSFKVSKVVVLPVTMLCGHARSDSRE